MHAVTPASTLRARSIFTTASACFLLRAHASCRSSCKLVRRACLSDNVFHASECSNSPMASLVGSPQMVASAQRSVCRQFAFRSPPSLMNPCTLMKSSMLECMIHTRFCPFSKHCFWVEWPLHDYSSCHPKDLNFTNMQHVLDCLLRLS